jgi:hypothetical protein
MSLEKSLADVVQYEWTVASALHQIQHGEMGTYKTDSAFAYLVDFDGGRITQRALLEVIHDLRSTYQSFPGEMSEEALRGEFGDFFGPFLYERRNSQLASAELREKDKRSYPHDEDCPRCGRRQWSTGPLTVDPMNPTDEEQSTCGACGYKGDE